MSKLSPYISIASILLLSACGGGSSSKSEPQPTGPFNFSLASVLKNDCGVESPYNDVELVLHDEDWSVIDTYFPDDNGLITLTTDQARINYTIIAKTKVGANDEGIEALSYSQADASLSGKYYATYDDKIDQLNQSSCDCVTQNVVFSHIPLAEIQEATSSLPYEEPAIFIDHSTTQFNNVTACKPKDQVWPVHSFSVHDGEDGVLGFYDDFVSNESGEWPVFVSGDGEPVNLNKNNPKLTTSQIFNGIRHFKIDVEQDSRQAMIFDNHKYIGDGATFFGQAEQILVDQTDSPKYYASFKSSDTVYSSDYITALDVKPSNNLQGIDWERFEEIKNSSYDYSKVDNHKMAVISFIFDAKNPETQLDMPASWTIYGPIEGSHPMSEGLPGYENIIAVDTKVDGYQVNLIRYHETSDYQDYINQQVINGNIPLEQQLDRKEQRIHQYFIKDIE